MRVRGLQQISLKILSEDTTGLLYFQGFKSATDDYGYNISPKDVTSLKLEPSPFTNVRQVYLIQLSSGVICTACLHSDDPILLSQPHIPEMGVG
jgi:hypothetical protein